MLPGINKKQMEMAMKKLGMKQEEINAEQVIIKTNNKEIIISNPQVSKINMMGQETFQITGAVSEHNLERFNKDDILTVMEATNANEQEAKKALEKEGDIAAAILSLKHKKT